MSQDIQDSTIDIENMDIPYHGMDQIIFMLDEKQDYGIWFAEDNTALGVQFNRGKLKDSFVYILRESITISKDGVFFDHEVIRNPHNVPKEEFESKDFYNALGHAMNDVVAQLLEWQKESHGT